MRRTVARIALAVVLLGPAAAGATPLRNGTPAHSTWLEAALRWAAELVGLAPDQAGVDNGTTWDSNG